VPQLELERVQMDQLEQEQQLEPEEVEQ